MTDSDEERQAKKIAELKALHSKKGKKEEVQRNSIPNEVSKEPPQNNVNRPMMDMEENSSSSLKETESIDSLLKSYIENQDYNSFFLCLRQIIQEKNEYLTYKVFLKDFYSYLSLIKLKTSNIITSKKLWLREILDLKKLESKYKGIIYLLTIRYNSFRKLQSTY
jgi:hypothetical protein